MTTPTTSYGSWAQLGTGGGCLTVADTVRDYLNDFVDDYDIDGVIDAYRAAINNELPAGVSLNGDEFYGPQPRIEDAAVIIRSAISRVDDLAQISIPFETLREQQD